MGEREGGGRGVRGGEGGEREGGGRGDGLNILCMYESEQYCGVGI